MQRFRHLGPGRGAFCPEQQTLAAEVIDHREDAKPTPVSKLGAAGNSVRRLPLAGARAWVPVMPLYQRGFKSEDPIPELVPVR